MTDFLKTRGRLNLDTNIYEKFIFLNTNFKFYDTADHLSTGHSLFHECVTTFGDKALLRWLATDNLGNVCQEYLLRAEKNVF